MTDIRLEPSWLALLQSEFEQPYMQQLRQFLLLEKQQGHTVYPRGSDIFNAFNATPVAQLKVVIIGQDPYHGPGQAHGLSFSVPEGVAIPPSLRNIYQEISQSTGTTMPAHGNLSRWAAQGVLLLNSVLTVRAGQAGSHQKQGWEQFTDAVVATINQHAQHCVFMLWGAYAKKKGAAIDTERHLVLHAPHPSPLSAHRGFLGCNHFVQANAYLKQTQQAEIMW